MSYERSEHLADSSAKESPQAAAEAERRESAGQAPNRSATVVVRGETVDEAPKPSNARPNADQPPRADHAPRKEREVAASKLALQRRLPALDDDGQVGTQREQVVVRDGKADLAFTGTLLASAAPPASPSGEWQEYRVYETNGGKHVFSKVSRSVYAEDADSHEAEIFDPAPSSLPSQLMKSARDLAHSRPVTWMDAAVGFFGYDPLAKSLYRKLGGQFEERIS